MTENTSRQSDAVPESEKGTSLPRYLGNIDMTDVKVVCFDLDDTIWACAPVLQRAGLAQTEFMQEHYPHVAKYLPPEGFGEFQSKIQQANPGKFHDYTVLRKHSLRHLATLSDLDEEHHDEFVEKSFEVFISERSNVLDHIYDGVLDMIARLRKDRNLQIVAITNGNANLSSIGNLLSDEYFAHHINPEMAGAAKPDPAPFQEMLRLTGAKPNQIVHVGDSFVSDVEPAKKLGMQTVWIVGNNPKHWGKAMSGEVSQVADAVLAYTSDLEKVFLDSKENTTPVGED